MNGDIWRSPPAEWAVEPRTGFLLRRYMLEGDGYDVAVSAPAATDAPLPLMIVLDAALHFDAVAGAASALARRAEKTGVAPMIVAGIASGAGWSHDRDRRARDLVPGNRFSERLETFLQDRLASDISRRFPVLEGALSLFGHSFGGLFALNALLDPGSGFATAIAVSPSLWRAPLLHDRQAVEGKRLLIVSGAREQRINHHLDSLSPTLSGGAGYRRLMLDDTDHGSAAFAAIPIALRFAQPPVTTDDAISLPKAP